MRNVVLTLFLTLLSKASWAMAAAPGAGGEGQTGNSFTLFAPMLLVFGIFYFLLIRPQQKQQKQHQNLLKDLKKGDEVILAAGIYGKITSVVDTTVQVEIADQVRVKVDKQQIAKVLTPATPTQGKP